MKQHTAKSINQRATHENGAGHKTNPSNNQSASHEKNTSQQCGELFCRRQRGGLFHRRPKMKAFPKGNTEWCKDDKLSNWCEACWGKFVRTRMLPRENERITKRKNQDPGNKHSLDQNPCKKCGAMTHKTSRSRLCPFNKKYADFSRKDNNTVVAAASASPSAVITTVSYTHLTLPTIYSV